MSAIIRPASPHWVRLFSHNTQRWRQFAASFNEHTVRLNPAFIPSIQAFQLTEQSEGKRLLAIANQYAARHHAPEYVAAIQQFIQEEQRHADYLSRVLRANGAGTLNKQWVDSIFRQLRQRLGPSTLLSLLLVAEIVAIAYYSSLARASEDLQAKCLFERILQDETTHIQFHCNHIAPCLSFTHRIGQHLVLGATIIVVWVEHSHVLKHRFRSLFQMMDYCHRLLTKSIDIHCSQKGTDTL